MTDFGMASLGDINPQATRFTNTMCPGTDVYMPPEAVQDKPVYTEKIDCFSFGVIIVQTLIRQFPKPGDRLQEVEFNHPGLPRARVCVRVPEIDHRQNHISQVDPNHSLLPIALNCLKDEGSERPSANQLCEGVADLKEKSDYRDIARAVQDKDEENQQLRQQIQEKDETNRQQSEEGERQIGLLNQQLRQLQLENELFSLTGKGSGRRWAQQYAPMPTKRRLTTSLCTGTALIVAGGVGESCRAPSIIEVMDTKTLQWSTAADLPQLMYCMSATVCGDQLYMLGTYIYYIYGGEGSCYVKSAHTCSVSALLQSCVPNSLEAKIQRTSLKDKAGVWRQITDVPIIQSTCESFHGRLLAVGGWMESGKTTTAVYIYNSTTNSWETISHMTTGRRLRFTAVLPDNRLMVVGGYNEQFRTIDSVELATVCDD